MGTKIYSWIQKVSGQLAHFVQPCCNGLHWPLQAMEERFAQAALRLDLLQSRSYHFSMLPQHEPPASWLLDLI